MPQYGSPYAGGCWHCDSCGYDTVNGYLVGTTDRWNDAKSAEEQDRVKHTIER